ncbi:MAG: radical SAM protein [Promethearchaeota archaeon]|nr:MAG: radical SAM protein [Candidatus Lokiarchaeota archaeon]
MRCKFCQKETELISETLGVCRECILKGDWNEIKPHIMAVHEKIRELENLPKVSPRASKSKIVFECELCINNCQLTNQDKSYCGLRNTPKDLKDNLPFPKKSEGYMHGYLDSNPTNCCNAWFCPAGTSRGFPKYSNTNGPEYGTYSYAAFLYGCSFDCLFCQNAQHKHFSTYDIININEIADQITDNKDITCICFFGGTPEPQLPFTIHLSKRILKKIKEQNERRFRICWEWNGSGKRELVEECMKLALRSGGNIKFDLKAFHERLNYALCGVSNERTLDNFKYLAENYFGTRGEEMPELSGCTLLVPGYTNAEEVENIAKFISLIDKNIPYSLLVFHPDYHMKDLPITPKKQAIQCLNIAKKFLNNVHLGNRFLLNLT